MPSYVFRLKPRHDLHTRRIFGAAPTIRRPDASRAFAAMIHRSCARADFSSFSLNYHSIFAIFTAHLQKPFCKNRYRKDTSCRRSLSALLLYIRRRTGRATDVPILIMLGALSFPGVAAASSPAFRFFISLSQNTCRHHRAHAEERRRAQQSTCSIEFSPPLASAPRVKRYRSRFFIYYCRAC